MAADALAFEFALDQHLRGDPGVVGADLPQGVMALHAVITHQRIHDGVIERMPHVQAARDVGRGNHDAVGVAGAAGFETPLGFPLGV